MLLYFLALVVVQLPLRSSAVRNLVGKNAVVPANLAAVDMLAHTAVKIIGNTYINRSLCGFVKDPVLALSPGRALTAIPERVEFLSSA